MGRDRSGKTTTVINFLEAHGITYFVKPPGMWFDGYTGEDVIVMDDYDNDMPLKDFLRVTNPRPPPLPVKGGFATNVCKKIIMTSNLPPEEQYHKVKDEQPSRWAAFRRRLDPCIHYTAFLDNNNIYMRPVHLEMAEDVRMFMLD